MATKKKAEKTPTPTGKVTDGTQTLYVPLSRVVIAKDRTRLNPPDTERVGQFAVNFIERRTEGKQHMIMPAVVRLNEDGETYMLIDGEHRYEACKLAQSETGDDYDLFCIVSEADDYTAFVDSVQANVFRQDISDFDKAMIIAHLTEQGKNNLEIAAILGCSDATVIQVRAMGNLDSKYRKAFENGDIDRDAAVAISKLPVADTKRAEIFERAMREKQFYTELETKIENRKAKEAADAKVAEAQAKANEIKEQASKLEATRKLQAETIKEIDKTASKTKVVDELIEIRKQTAEAQAEHDKTEAARKELDAQLEKAKKEIEKAKAAKESLKEVQAAKVKLLQEDVKSAAQAEGVVSGKTSLTAKRLYAELEAIGSDEVNEMPKAVNFLLGKVQAFMDGDIKAPGFRKALLLACKTDAQFDTAKAAKK